jgi:hypothetical protein
MKIYRSIKKN